VDLELLHRTVMSSFSSNFGSQVPTP